MAQPPVDLSPWNSGSPSSRTSAATAAEGWAICNGPAPQEDSVSSFLPDL
ncbi:hypothetical protein PC110_g23849 [Phytophthora cactorum]|uniref:Uncharacterized protein n=1 Tax=Phytophthora cactorum TaxID=29920 RepID=A0A329R6S9_9STRA|nr:hypothetical protein PC114_g28174 [Phytophthora cactorum]KAG2869890.1 hypothetical protein PC115_g25290 [Phytophthora cactorum]KAG2872433.1 hypothetical protein PC117_g28027 [Phytophthora cactorum]KAG2954693.1 hypothetical protein PC119_g27963 [Phytophthora cactorum]KAG2956674.1 hypothetical protein PC120_g28662 [Phytophthora cactorum]